MANSRLTFSGGSKLKSSTLSGCRISVVWLCGCLQNEDLRPKTQKRRPKNEDPKTKTQKRRLVFLQAYQTRDSQTGSTLFLRHQMMRNQGGLRFVVRAGLFYKTKTP